MEQSEEQLREGRCHALAPRGTPPGGAARARTDGGRLEPTTYRGRLAGAGFGRRSIEEILWDPGNEVFAFAAVGGELSPFTWELGAEGVWGEPPVREGLRLPSAERKIIQFFPKVGVPAGPLTLEIGGRIPVDGRNLPAGPALRAGFFSRVDLF